MPPPPELEPFLLLARSARGRAAAELVLKATAAPGVFVFGELLDEPNVAELKNGDLAPYHAMLELFAYGTWADYRASPSSFPAFTDAHTAKLKALTLASLAAPVPRGGLLPYAAVAAAVDTPPGRALDDLLIEGGLYSGLLDGRLDAGAAGVRVARAAPRDVRRGDLPRLVAGLAAWLDAARGVAASLETAGRGALAAAAESKAGAAAAAAAAAAADAGAAGGAGNGGVAVAPLAPGEGEGGVGATPDAMDDDGAGRPKRRR